MPADNPLQMLTKKQLVAYLQKYGTVKRQRKDELIKKVMKRFFEGEINLSLREKDF